MSERYSKVFSLQGNLYCEGAPVLIEAGALLKDNLTGKILAQIKFKNIQNKNIKAIVVKISPMNVVGKPLGDEIEYQYLDFDEPRNASFGSKVPIVLPNETTRAFTVIATNVIFSDNSTWEYADEKWEPLREMVTLEQAFGDGGIVEQYRFIHGKNCKYKFQEYKDLWYCTCGAINHDDEPICHMCHLQSNELEEIDTEKLEDDFDERREQEMEVALERKARRKARGKKATKWIAIAAVVLLVFGAAGTVVAQMLKKNQAYNKAVLLVAGNDYDKAKKALKDLGNYKDCPELLEKVTENEKEAQYTQAKSLLDEGFYSEAVEQLKKIGDYKDSTQLATQLEQEMVAVDQAIQAYRMGDFTTMLQVFSTHQYVFPADQYKSNIMMLQSYIGSWEYATGNAKVLNMREKAKEGTKYEKCKSITTTAQFLDTGEDAILLTLNNFGFNFKLNYIENKLEPITSYSGGTYKLSLTEAGNLLVTLERHDKKTITCEYKRVP